MIWAQCCEGVEDRFDLGFLVLPSFAFSSSIRFRRSCAVSSFGSGLASSPLNALAGDNFRDARDKLYKRGSNADRGEEGDLGDLVFANGLSLILARSAGADINGFKVAIVCASAFF